MDKNPMRNILKKNVLLEPKIKAVGLVKDKNGNIKTNNEQKEILKEK